MVSPFSVTGQDELRALIAEENVRSTDVRRRRFSPTHVGKSSALKSQQSTRMSEDTLVKALRLFSRLGRVNARARGGHDVMDPLMSKIPRSKRILKMLAIVKKGSSKVISRHFGSGLLMNKNLDSTTQMRLCTPGADHNGGGKTPSAPTLNKKLGSVEWAGLEVPLATPSCCVCGCTQLTPRTLGRYGPTAVLDAIEVHLVLRQDVRCTACHKQIYCSDEDVKRHFETKGIYPVRAVVQPDLEANKFQGAGCGRKTIWHTVPFIAMLYQTLRQTRSLEALRAAYMSKLQGRAMESTRLREHSSLVLQYWLSFVPASATLRNLVRDFHHLRVSPQVMELRKCVAKRTRVYKVDGHRKAAKLVKDATHAAPKTAILPVMNEEGCLVGPPRRVSNEGRVGFAQGLNENLDIHVEANLESSDKGALLAFGTDDYGQTNHGTIAPRALQINKEKYCWKNTPQKHILVLTLV